MEQDLGALGPEQEGVWGYALQVSIPIPDSEATDGLPLVWVEVACPGEGEGEGHGEGAEVGAGGAAFGATPPLFTLFPPGKQMKKSG
jgi:hypothetical protein